MRKPKPARSAVAAAAAAAALVPALATSASAAIPRYGPVQELVTLPKPTGHEWAPIPTTAVGDFNGDRLDDLLVTRARWPTDEPFDVLVLLNDGFGGLTDGSTSWDGPPARTIFPYRIAVADFNGDGADDAFVADTGSDVPPFSGAQSSLLLSTGAGTVRDASGNLPRQSAYTYFTDAADVDRDGDRDLFLANTIRATPQILLNDGQGRFAVLAAAIPAALDPPANATAARFADVDRDGDPDLVVAGADVHADGYRFPPNTFVLLNDGQGRFAILPGALPPKPFAATGEAIDMKVLELNGDGAPDLVISWTKGVPYYYGRWLQLLVNDGRGSFRDETAARLPQADNLSTVLETIELHDVDRDGTLDIFAIVLPRAPNWDEVAPFFLNDGTGRFTAFPGGLGTDTGNTATMLDLDGDGGLDVVFTKDALRMYVRRELAAPVSTLYATTAGGTSLETETGDAVVRLRAGRYQVVVRDTTRRAGFRLRGPGVAKATPRAFVGRASWRVTLRPGVYRYGATTSRRSTTFRVTR
jgi:hypothetical protein